jgi:RNA polymerase subunit RPABC4/transcription elongation factor Spt4
MEVEYRYSESNQLVYCKHCGAVAGQPTECPRFESHDFRSTKVPVVCSHCGAVPGRPTECPRFESHDFRPVSR